MGLGFLVVDGANQGRFFPLVKSGVMVIGSSHRNTDICLNDLYVARVHCQVELADGRVSFRNLDETHGTLVNGQPANEQEVHLGDVLRLGNSHLRLEDMQSGEEGAANHAAAPEKKAETPAAPPKPPPLETLVGHKFGHFEISALLGKGNHGAVFRANDLKNAATVALKVLSLEFPSSEQETQQFAQALRIALPLRHPHLVGVRSAGRTGIYSWISMELIEGESAAQILERIDANRKIKWLRGLRVALHLAQALQIVHHQQLIHQNICPANVLIQAGDKTTKLNDLVLARALDKSLLHQETLKAMKPAQLSYLAPEQTHSGGFVDHLCDIYSLGAVVYALLTGRPPFSATNVEHLMVRIRERKPAPPKQYQPSIPDGLQTIVLRMLEKSQEARYQSAAELIEDLEEFAEEQEVEV